MKSHHYILGYYVSLLPLALLQMVLFFLLAIPLGLKFSIGVLLCVLVGLLVSTLFIFLGILIGCVTTQKSSSGLSSAVVQLVAFTSGMYFSTEMIGGFFSVLCKILPFKSCLDLLKGVSLLSFTDLLLPILIFTGYTILIVVLAVIVFKNSLYSSKK
jgi:ABC-2 type transport system permease protein